MDDRLVMQNLIAVVRSIAFYIAFYLGSVLFVCGSVLFMNVWQKGFHDRAVRQEDDLPAIARYVVANPVRAGLVTKTGTYPHWDAIWV